MVVTINNISTDLSPNTTLAEALAISGIGNKVGIAIAVNDNVISKNLWDKLTLNENDKILVITPTQGG